MTEPRLSHNQMLEIRGSGSLQRMIAAVSYRTNPVDRHFLLQDIVGLAYKQRTDPEMRALCRQYSQMHIAEFPMLAAPLRGMVGGFLPSVPTFKHYATVLTEDGEYERAIEICRLAIKYKVDEVISDGTKSGYAGRIARIEKKMKQTTTP